MGKVGEDVDVSPVKMEKKSKKNKDQIREDADANPVKMKKKSKKSKNETIDQLDIGDDETHHLKEKAHKKKKKKSESNEDEDRTHKNNLEDDGGSRKKDKKKRKKDSSENAETKENEPAVDKDGDPKPKKQKKKKHRSLENEPENCVIDKKKEKRKEKKKKTINQDSDPAYLEKKLKPKSKGKSKRVSFSAQVEVFPSSDTDSNKQKSKGNDGLVRGKRFTPEEDAIVKEAVLNYIAARQLGEEGLKMVLNCSSHPGMKKCWQEIGTCIPYRPYTAIYSRAHVLFERGENRSWTPEEIEFLKEFHEKNGNNWKMAADELGKHRMCVKDTWRRIKLQNLKLGQWSQEEYQILHDLVNLDLQMKINCEVKQSKHGMLRDNIPWGAISEKLETRSDATCCTKWYNQLTSSLVAEKKWSDADDYRLIGALYELDATCEEDVEWDELLEHRSGEVCRKRWDQMVRHIGHQGSKPFGEQVDTLAKRYCPDLAEVREAWDNKPVV